jgi:catechol-2,3-dioxygenase
MKRLHIHLSVDDLAQSIGFYTDLFGEKPSKQKDDYAQWMLDNPKVNFAISTRGEKKGLDHFGIQVEEESELQEITARLEKADRGLFDQGVTECCYSRSNKAWVQDPGGIAWEAYQSRADVEVFSPKKETPSSACCAPETSAPKTSCC